MPFPADLGTRLTMNLVEVAEDTQIHTTFYRTATFAFIKARNDTFRWDAMRRQTYSMS